MLWNLNYLMIFVVPFLCGLFMGLPAWAVLVPLSVGFLFHPIIDKVAHRWFNFPAMPQTLPSRAGWLPRFAVFLCLPFQGWVLYRAFTLGVSSLDAAVVSGVLAGLSGGIIGIAAGHELIHRKSKLARLWGKGLLYAINYPHFAHEHMLHHLHVATPLDPDTARTGESFYRFFIRSVPQGYRMCWRKNPSKMRVLTATQIGLTISAGLIFGGYAPIAFITQGIVTLALLKWINYVEHYGLLRLDGEPVGHHHSWDCVSPFTNWSLFNLGYHSEHHRTASLPFYRLPERKSEWHTYPEPYVVMMLYALVPSLWRKQVHPLIGDRHVG